MAAAALTAAGILAGPCPPAVADDRVLQATAALNGVSASSEQIQITVGEAVPTAR
ncbi:hypothetical protein SHKM778_01470 [Streptomyces sp. KM77-8]|uniref:Uncharacterized protein n=1 Tax=Streptomyces haneummycinicus TaxID=3074435 RepID=A0AAT9H8S9_9ACTN